MGKIGKYTDRQCQERPEVMKLVLMEHMYNFENWPTCYIGTINRVANARFLWGSAEEMEIGSAVAFVSARLRSKALYSYMKRTGDCSQGVWLRIERDTETRVEQMIKNRIRRALARQTPVQAPPRVLLGSIFRALRPTRREVAVANGFAEPLVWHPDEVETASPAELTFSG